MMRCNVCGSTDTEVDIHHERGHYEGAIQCKGCGTVMVVHVEGLGELADLLDGGVRAG